MTRSVYPYIGVINGFLSTIMGVDGESRNSSDNGYSLAFKGGVDLRVTDNVLLRTGVRYQAVSTGLQFPNNITVYLGLGFGS